MLNRRQFIGGLSAVGGTMPFLNGESKVINGSLKERAKSVIYIFMAGGLSQFESFNVEIDKKTMGTTTAHKSNADGVRVSQYFPNMAKQMDKVTVINSMKINQGAHPSAIYKLLTSYNPRSSITHPELGAWINKCKSQKTDTLPNFVSICSRRQGTSGFFPGKYAALPVVNPAAGIMFSKRHNAVNEKVFKERLNLVSGLNKNFQKQFGTDDSHAYTDIYADSVKFMNSKDISTFDLKKENENITKLYAKDSLSQGCLLAGRLAEKGVKFSKVDLGGWDHHQKLFTDLPPKAAMLDQALSSLLQHLSQKGLLDTTLVVLATEFGRSPLINVNAGRDHHPKGFTCLLAGAGVKGGQIYGKTSKDGKEIIENPVDVVDFNATIAWSLGIKPDHEEMSPSGRPFKLSNKGKAQTQLFS